MNTASKFEEFAKESVDLIIDNLRTTGAYTTGKTARSLHFEASETRMTIYGGRSFTPTDRFTFVESGRGATKNDQGGVLYPAILEWLRAKRGGRTKGDEGIAYVITQRIHEFGTSLWRRNQHRDIAQSVFSDERLSGLYKHLEGVLYREIESEVVKRIKEGFKVR